jgi:hypothetical protein
MGVLVFVGCLAAGGALMGTGHWVIGLALMLASVPGAIVAWIKWSDRRYGG